MTPEERLRMTSDERNAGICKDYNDGMSLYDLGQKWQLSRQWIHRILREANVAMRPRSDVRVNRDTFLGANINEDTKNAITKIAAQRGTSVSAVTEEALQELVRREETA